ncbi:MAG: spore coat protein CotJB [Erysipelotrichaceae bacterium]|nr:spore coat protein CotJB [Erysipelotrichaceae bacterium]
MNYNVNYFTPNQPPLFDPEEALTLGNLFKNLYMSYKGFSNYYLQPSSERQKALLTLQMYEFAAHEINLYLDLYPDNEAMLSLFEEYTKKAHEARKQFVKMYGPIEVKETHGMPFSWIEGPWPWEYQ